MRNIRDVVRAKELRLQELDREMQRIQAQLQTLHSAVTLLEEEDDTAGSGRTVTEASKPEGRRQSAPVADNKSALAMNAQVAQKQFP